MIWKDSLFINWSLDQVQSQGRNTFHICRFFIIIVDFPYRTEDHFDSLPAIEVSFKFTKIITCEMAANNNTAADMEKKPLKFTEFGVFLKLLHQYYVYCQVCCNVPFKYFPYNL